jgi:hypothetical protein
MVVAIVLIWSAWFLERRGGAAHARVTLAAPALGHDRPDRLGARGESDERRP